MNAPRARPDAPALYPFTLEFRDATEEAAYREERLSRFSRRRYAMTTTLSAGLWIVCGSWLMFQFPEHRGVLLATMCTFAPLLLLLSTAAIFVLPLPLAQRWMPRATLVVSCLVGLIPAVIVATGLWVLLGLCMYLLTLHSFLGLRFLHALQTSLLLIIGYFVGLAVAGSTWITVGEASLWLSAALTSAMFVSYTQEKQRRRVFHTAGLLSRERAKSERLLANMLPAGIVERLKNEPLPIADAVSEATVLFADLVGFTTLSSKISPRELVTLLNDIFTTFDALAARHGLEKIKTIGDAYMVVAGVPTPRADHAEAMVRFALELRAAAGNRSLAMRIGIHSGPVVAGVIGTSKYSYDLWGDTVNTASRMESHGAPDRIHVSAQTAALLGDRWTLEERGEIEVKGKGPLRTSWLVGARS